MVWEVRALPTHVRLIAPLVVGATQFSFIPLAGTEDLGQRTEVLRRDASACAANRAGRAATVVVIGVELGGAEDQARLGRNLPVDALGGRMLFLRVCDVPIQKGVRAVGVERPWLVLGLVGAEEVQSIFDDGTTKGHA